MRKIEKEMNKAITEGRNWSSSNTMVRVDPDTNTAMVYLFDNHIGVGIILLRPLSFGLW